MDVESWVGGLAFPWDLVFVTPDTILFTERADGLEVAWPDRSVTTVAGGRPDDLVVGGEAGMMGIALDPDFATNRRLYLCFASNAVGRSTCASRASSSTTASPRCRSAPTS